ncbi:MAG TPA: energy transducer TonB [Terriglobales bacterium]|nr:energy transducer TonB [Terriglobales bacterium]
MKNLWTAFAVILVAGSIYLVAQTQDQPQSSSQPASPAPNSTPPAQNDQSHQGGIRTTPPHAIYSPDPDYPIEARRAKVQGLVTLKLTVAPDGATKDIQVVKHLRSDLDANAVDAVRTWKFEPATKDGKPVAVSVNIDVAFRLY